MRFKKSTFWVQKVHFWGVPHLPKMDPGYGPEYLHPFEFSSLFLFMLQTLDQESEIVPHIMMQ